MPGMLARQRPSLGASCQSGKMAKPLNSLCFVFNILFLPNYSVKYYDYIIKRSTTSGAGGYLLNFSFNSTRTLHCAQRNIYASTFVQTGAK